MWGCRGWGVQDWIDSAKWTTSKALNDWAFRFSPDLMPSRMPSNSNPLSDHGRQIFGFVWIVRAEVEMDGTSEWSVYYFHWVCVLVYVLFQTLGFRIEWKKKTVSSGGKCDKFLISISLNSWNKREESWMDNKKHQRNHPTVKNYSLGSRKDMKLQGVSMLGRWD